jgi:hypothetical protein
MMELYLHSPICLHGVVLNYTKGKLYTFVSNFLNCTWFSIVAIIKYIFLLLFVEGNVRNVITINMNAGPSRLVSVLRG